MCQQVLQIPEVLQLIPTCDIVKTHPEEILSEETLSQVLIYSPKKHQNTSKPNPSMKHRPSQYLQKNLESPDQSQLLVQCPDFHYKTEESIIMVVVKQSLVLEPYNKDSSSVVSSRKPWSCLKHSEGKDSISSWMCLFGYSRVSMEMMRELSNFMF